MSKVLSHEAMSLMAVSHTAHDKISWNALWDYIADLEEFKAVVAGCGFEVITEPPVLNHPERKILKGPEQYMYQHRRRQTMAFVSGLVVGAIVGFIVGMFAVAFCVAGSDREEQE